MLHLVLLLWALPCETQERRPPVIRFNSEVLNRTEVVLSHKKPLILHCEGDGPVTWHPRLAKQKKLVVNNGNTSVISVGRSKADHTGTYNCSYLSLPELYSSVHVYVRDPNQLFTISTAYNQVKKEGDNCLLPCLLTNPTATGLSLRMNNGSSVPPGMNYSADPRRGILIRNLHPSYNADYVCSAKINGMENISQTFSLNIIQRLYFPPYVFLELGEYVRIAGEKLQISCKTHNPNFNYNVTWKHNLHSKTIVKENVRSGNRLDIESTLTIPAVNMSDTGNITCIGINEAGVNSSTTYLQVVDKPYLRLSPQLSPKLDREGMVIKTHPGNDLCLGVQIEAYPPITAHRWETPSSHKNSSQENSFYQHNNRYEASILLKRMNAEEQGEYSFYAKSDKADAYITFRVQMYQKPVTTVTSQMNGSSLICTAIGYPAPRIHWFLCPGITTICSENATEPVPDETMEVQREEFGLVEVKSVLTMDPASHRMTLECVASNLAGEDSTTFSIDVTMRPPLDKLFTPTLAGAAGVSGFFLFLLLILLYKYKQKPRYEIRWKIIEASNGNNYTFIDPLQLPYNEKWEFPRDKLRLGKILGAGAFGKVVEATAYGLGKEDNVTRVAVKMLKPSAHSDEKEALMSELKILSHLGRHQNIVNLLGACTHGGPVLVITEYCRHGDLLNFLRNKAENFLTFVMSMPGFLEETSDYKNICIEKKYIRSDSGISSSCSDNYLEMKPSPAQTTGTSQDPSCEEAEGDTWPLDMDDLLRFSYQVAQGLDFLAAKNCIHRDVAARNVLLTDGCVAKICDFGLARDIMNDSNYVVKGNARLPVKWMAPESIFECVYTVQSDVWSYGILLWEIFSLGKSPYPSMLVDTKFYKMIKCGYQMSRPDFSPPEMYEIMKMCWNLKPTERPTFSKISQLIERLLDQPEQKTNPSTQMDVLEEQSESREAPKGCEESCDQSCDQEEEELPLMKTNNYQFC